MEPDQIYVLIETEGVGSITGLSEPEEFVDLVLFKTPEHDADGNTSVLDGRRDLRVPKVEHPDALGIFEESNPLVVPHSPSNTELSGTSWSVGRKRGLNTRGRLGGRRGRVALGRLLLVGSACWFGSRAGRVGLASLGTTLLLGDAVVVRKLSGQVVRRYGDRKGLGRSEREEKDSECGQREDVERLDDRHLFKGSLKSGRKVKSDCGLAGERRPRRRREQVEEGKGIEGRAAFMANLA